jgi:hypothetical protein
VLLSELTVPDITAAKLLEYPEEEFLQIHELLKHIRPGYEVGKIRATSLVELTFEQVETIKLKTTGGEFQTLLEAMETVYSVETKELLKLKCYDFYKLFNWFTQSLNELIEREKKMFKNEGSDQMWRAAAGDRFSKFGAYNTAIPLAEKFGQSPAAIMKMTYLDVFSARLYYKELADTQKEYDKLAKQKQELSKR